MCKGFRRPSRGAFPGISKSVKKGKSEIAQISSPGRETPKPDSLHQHKPRPVKSIKTSMPQLVSTQRGNVSHVYKRSPKERVGGLPFVFLQKIKFCLLQGLILE